VTSPDGGYFGGAASGDHSLIALGGYASNDPGSAVSERNITFIDAAGTVLARHGVGGGSWAVAMTPDGAWIAVGSENEQLYLFKGTELFASGRPIAGNAQLRGIAVTDDGRYVAAARAGVTLHDLSADDPISPIFEDRTTDQSRAVDFSDDGRYLAYGGRVGTSNI
jgi:WD40 repeat protein